MLVFGGSAGSVTNTGGEYDLTGDSWTASATTGAPALDKHVAVWTGGRMIVWGGDDGAVVVNTGGQLLILSLYRKN